MSGPTLRQLAESDWGREHLLLLTVQVPPKPAKPKETKK